MYHFLQKLICSLRPSSTNANLLQRVPLSFVPFLRNLQNRKTPKGPPPNFFRHCANFFSKIFNVSKESHLRIFLFFATDSMLMNPKGSPLFIFRHYATFSKFFSKKKFFKNFFFNKIFNFFLFPVGKSDFPVISSMKGTLWVSRKCFQSFS